MSIIVAPKVPEAHPGIQCLFSCKQWNWMLNFRLENPEQAPTFLSSLLVTRSSSGQIWVRLDVRLYLQHALPWKGLGTVSRSFPCLIVGIITCREWSDPFYLASFYLSFFLFISRDLRLSESMMTPTFILPKAWQDRDKTGRNRISHQQKAECLLSPFQDWHVYS